MFFNSARLIVCSSQRLGAAAQRGPPFQDIWRKSSSAVQMSKVLPPRPKPGYDLETCTERQAWVESVTGVKLNHIFNWWGDNDETSPMSLKRNCENPIGTAKIPIGLIGPIDIQLDGEEGLSQVIAPFATLEGSLIASICRGAKVINMCGGVRTAVVDQRVARAPLFILDSPAAAVRFGKFAEANFSKLQELAHQQTSHGRLIGLEPFYDGSAVHLRFVYATGDASGQNMTTICTAPCEYWLCKNAPAMIGVDVKFSCITAGADGDKRACAGLSIFGRGHHVAASVDIPEKVLQDAFRTTTHQLMAYWYPYQDRVQGRIGNSFNNFNMSNVVAGLFAATGQDLGAVPESSQANIGFSLLPSGEKGIRAEVVFPSLVIGTVGGGTGLPTQRESLEIMDCLGAGKVQRLAQIIAAFSLAQDLSIMGAVASDEFTSAHITFARN